MEERRIMCDALWSTGCKKHDVEVILVDPKTAKRLDICHGCWSKVPKTWEWGKRRKKMSKEEKKAMADPNWKWDEIIVHEEKKYDENYIPFGKHAWIRKDALEEPPIEEILEKAEKEEARRYKRKRKRKRRKKKRR